MAPGSGHFVPKPALAIFLTTLLLQSICLKMAEKEAKEQNQDLTDNNVDINADEAMGGTTHLNEPLEAESTVDKLTNDLKESQDKFLRLAAEFDNFKRRNARERIELIQTAGKDVIGDLLEILDDVDRAQEQFGADQDIDSVKKGSILIFNKLRNKLQARGLKAMESIGEDFNADLHEAITQVPAPDPSMKGKVIDVLTKGYYLNDKIIRHAKVVVGN